MKKYILLAALYVSLLWIGCKEKIPAGLILQATSIAKDTSYISNIIPAAQLKNVLLEEFTGVTCSNCPTATQQIISLQNQYNPRLLVVKIHSNLQAKPIEPTDPDFRNSDADNLATSFNLASKPSAGIDRLPNGTANYCHPIASLSNKIINQLSKPTPINIELSKQINATLDSITLTTMFTFNTSTTDKYRYHIYLLENDVEATQDSFWVSTLKTVPIEGYKHEEILRKCITPVFVGTPLPDSSQVAGRVYKKSMQFAKPTNVLNINNGEIVVLITDEATKEVIHCQRIALK
jgi:Outer membrane protein Omp28